MYKNVEVLVESSHVIDDVDVIQRLKIKCSESLDLLARGKGIYFATTHAQDKVMLVRASQHEYEEGKYQLLHEMLDMCPEWKFFPKRSISTICSTSKRPAQSGSTVYVVLPVNGSKVGVCSDATYGESFNRLEKAFGIRNVIEFEREFKLILNLTEQFVNDKDFPDQSDIKEIQRVCAMFDNIMKTFKGLHDFKTMLRTVSDINVDEWLRPMKEGLFMRIMDALDPDLNGFDVARISELDGYKNREIWFTNDCYMIEKRTFDELLDSGKLSNYDSSTEKNK